MIERTNDALSLKTQAELLSLSRSSLYYQTKAPSAQEVWAKRHIDVLLRRHTPHEPDGGAGEHHNLYLHRHLRCPNASGLLETITDPLGHTTSYAYDAVGNRISMTDAASVVTRYEYDALGRLTAVVENHIPSSPADHETNVRTEYAYDPAGNRLLQETHDATNVYAYDAANRLVEVDGVAYAWDANGNLLDDGERTYTYDHANRLTALSDQGTLYAYAYNGQGDRLQQSVNGVPTNYALDLNAGLTQVLEAGTNAYLYGLGRIGEVQTGGWQYHLADALGSSRQLIDASATVNRTRSYEPFGSVLLTAGNGASSYGFAGEWLDYSELIYLRFRYYYSNIGRFISADKWYGCSSLPHSQNRYSYGMANPLTYSDPSGENPIGDCIGLLALLATIDGPVPIGDAAGGIICLGILSSAGITALIAAQQADEATQAVDELLGDTDTCIRTWEDILNLPVAENEPEPEPAPEPRQVGPDIIPRVTEIPKLEERSPVRVQLQEWRATYESILLQDPGDRGGVTTLQVNSALTTLKESAHIPKRQQRNSQSAYNKAVKWVNSRPPLGVFGGGDVKFSFHFDRKDPKNGWRFDIDILAGQHLTR